MKNFIKETGHYFGFASFVIMLICCGFYCMKNSRLMSSVETGYLFHGQKYVEYKNGEKIGKSLAEVKDDESKGRVPSSFKYGDNGNEVIYFQKYNGVTCFYTANEKEQMQSISCLKN